MLPSQTLPIVAALPLNKTLTLETPSENSNKYLPSENFNLSLIPHFWFVEHLPYYRNDPKMHREPILLL